MNIKSGLLALSLCLLPQFAVADERGSFVTLDREGTNNAIGLDVSALLFTNDSDPDAGLRENLWGRYVSPIGLGGYAQFAVSQLFTSEKNQGAINNVELGALYQMNLGGDADLEFHLGVGLPTGPKDDFAAVIANAATIGARVQDLALSAAGAVWIRPGVGIRLGSKRLFAQLDSGLDIPINDEGYGYESLIHLNAGVGTTQGPLALTLEAATLISAFGPGDADAIHNFGASIRYVDGSIQPFLAYVLPIHFGDPVTAHVVTAGVQGQF